MSQAVLPLARVAATYQALNLGTGGQMLGLLSAVFSLLPVLLTVSVGRFIDRGGVGLAVLGGGFGVLAGCLILWLAQDSLAGLFLGMALLGISQSTLFSSMQMITTMASTKAHRDAILGNYMVAVSLGQTLGPLLLGLAPDTSSLLWMLVIGAAGLVLVLVLLRRTLRQGPHRAPKTQIPLAEIAATRGLPWIIMLGATCVTAQDLLLAFLPVLGQELGIAPGTIGILLSIRGVASMVSRLFFGRAVRWLGRMRLVIVSALAGGLGLVALLLPMPVWAMGAVLAVVGFGLAITVTCSVSLTLSIAPQAARGTALTLRMTVNRILQFAAPALSGLGLASLGAGGIFALAGFGLLGTLAARPRGLTVPR